MNWRRVLLTLVLVAGLLLLALKSCGVGVGWREEVDPAQARDVLTDDPRPERPQPFVEGLVDSRTLPTPQQDGTTVEFEVNSSPAVVRLDILDIRSDEDEALREVHAQFASAASAIDAAGFAVLPSVNVLDAKAKQIDDGIMAALEVHLFLGPDGVDGTDGAGGQVVEFVRALRTAAGSEAHAWLTASLVLAGVEDGDAAASALVESFMDDRLLSRPIGFHDWSGELERTYRCLRFLQQPLAKSDAVHVALERALSDDGELRARHTRLLTVLSLASNRAAEPVIGSGASRAALLPASGSRELDFVRRLFPMGVPEGANLMQELVLAIRDGRVDLTPNEESGWYEHRAHALEVFLLPERALEHEKLMLTRRYKQRLIEAYEARVTNVMETHSGMMGVASAVAPPRDFMPRLRAEPCATYALRIARSFSFIEGVLEQHVPELLDRRGLGAAGPRAQTLRDELAAAQRLFLGVHLVVAEDLGFEPTIHADELARDQYEPARTAAAQWLASWPDDLDLAVDSRVAFSVAPTNARSIRVWCTTGVRAARLEARYVHAPHVRPRALPGAAPEPWTELEPWQTSAATFVLLVEEFEELTFAEPPTRAELRSFLDARR